MASFEGCLKQFRCSGDRATQPVRAVISKGPMMNAIYDGSANGLQAGQYRAGAYSDADWTIVEHCHAKVT